MPRIQVLNRSIDGRFTTPKRLSEIVGYGGNHQPVDSIIGPVAEAADLPTAVAAQQRAIDFAGQKIEAELDGRILQRQRYRSRQPGSDDTELELPFYPVEDEALEVEGVDLDNYRLNEESRRYVYRDGGWRAIRRAARYTQDSVAGTEIDLLRVDFTAGCLMPGQIQPWVVDRSYIPKSSSSVGAILPDFGSWTFPSDPNNRLRFECTTAGDTAATEPDWPTATPWEAGKTYGANEWVLATDIPIGLWFEPTTPGTSGETEPVWPLIVDDNDTVVDGSVTWTVRSELTFADGANLIWTAHFAAELPVSLQEIAALWAIELTKKTIGQDCDEQSCATDFRQMAESLRFLAASK